MAAGKMISQIIDNKRTENGTAVQYIVDLGEVMFGYFIILIEKKLFS
jgi:hypothetical protein